jgi:hypothetical protein
MQSANSEKQRPVRRLVGRLIKAPAAFAVLWPVLLIVGGYAAWHRWGAVHVAGKYSGIDPTLIQVNDPPAHVRTNVVKTVYRDTAMEGLSILDRQATAKIASAFSLHPWVRRVIGVRKLPGGQIDVRLEYRTPVAMVHVYKPNDPDNRSYFFPVDGEGVLLPGNEFAEAETRNYIYIEVPDVYTSNAVGTPFGDATVEAASALASILSPYREQTQIRSIGVHGDPRQTEVLQMELTMQSGARMTWGSPPGNEVPGEPTVQMKLKSLLGADLRQNADLRVASPSQALQR